MRTSQWAGIRYWDMKKKIESMVQLSLAQRLIGMKNRILQALARSAGTQTWRVRLHRWRGVKIATDVHISSDVIVEIECPHWVSIGNNVQIGVRTTIIAHMHGLPPTKEEFEDKEYVSVRIEDNANIGAGAMILPNVTIGHGAVVTAGSIVSSSVPPLTMVQGNPARPIAQCGIPLTWEIPIKEFFRKLRPIREKNI
ncbi:MAG: acyltransferase [Candidatus Tectomicrobia bacterium]|nr:acyltransferase [Candidatus Tectomicrobia bacterium]